MNRIAHDRLAAEIIGEAAFYLLQEKGPINKHSLIRQLQLMATKEVDSERCRYITHLIVQMNDDSTHFLHRDALHQSDKRSGDNVYPLFGSAPARSTSKKH